MRHEIYLHYNLSFALIPLLFIIKSVNRFSLLVPAMRGIVYPQHSQLESQSPAPENVTFRGDRVITEVIELNAVMRVDLHAMELVSLRGGEIWAGHRRPQGKMQGRHTGTMPEADGSTDRGDVSEPESCQRPPENQKRGEAPEQICPPRSQKEAILLTP